MCQLCGVPVSMCCSIVPTVCELLLFVGVTEQGQYYTTIVVCVVPSGIAVGADRFVQVMCRCGIVGLVCSVVLRCRCMVGGLWCSCGLGLRVYVCYMWVLRDLDMVQCVIDRTDVVCVGWVCAGCVCVMCVCVM